MTLGFFVRVLSVSAVSSMMTFAAQAGDAPLTAPGARDLSNTIVQSDGSPVKPNGGRYTGRGYIVGSPINSGYVGTFYQTYEVHVNQGRFADDTTYIGSNFHMSIDDRDVKMFNKFRAIEERNHEMFVFEYEYKSAWNPEIEETHYFLKEIYTIPQFLDLMKSRNLSKGIVAKNPWNGSRGSKRKVGRIVDVERTGIMDDFCAVELNLGGLRTGGGGESLVTMSIVEEDICRWVELAIAKGKDVEVDISEDAFEAWNPSDLFVTAIKFKDEKPGATQPTQPGQLQAGGLNSLSDEQYAKLKERLLKDPEFLQRLLNAQGQK